MVDPPIRLDCQRATTRRRVQVERPQPSEDERPGGRVGLSDARQRRPRGGEEHPPDAVPPGRGVGAARVGPSRTVKALTYANRTCAEAGEMEGLGSASFDPVAAAWSYFRRLGLEEHLSSLGGGRRSRVLSDTVFKMAATSAHQSVLQETDDHRVARLGGAFRPRPVLPGDRRPGRAQGGHRGAPVLEPDFGGSELKVLFTRPR